ASSAFAEYSVPNFPPGDHVVRIAFTNDAASSAEDRNLIVDVVRTAPASVLPTGAFTLVDGQPRSFPFAWRGGPGDLLAMAATPATLNVRQRLQVDLDGVPTQDAVVAGPVARPRLTPFDLPNGTHTVTYRAVGGPVILSDLRLDGSPPPLAFTGAAARVHVGGSAEGSGWRFTDFGFLESPIVVPASGLYDLRVQGAGTVATVGPLVHLWLNRTVVAEGEQGTRIDLTATRYLVAGVGYTLGASFEDPFTGPTARLDTLSVAPAAAVPMPFPPAPLDPPTATSGWPQYGRDGWNTRSNPDPALPGPASPAVQLRWRTHVDGSVTGTPAVAEGRVYVGTWAKSMYALDEATGQVVWRTTLPAAVDGSAAVDGGLVFVAAKESLYALRADTGAIAWSRAFSGHLWASPIVQGGDLFMGVDADRGYLAKLAPATGAVAWQVATTPQAGAGARVWASPLAPAGSGLVVIGTSPGTDTGQPSTMDSLIALDRADGHVVWSHRFFPYDTNQEDTPEVTRALNRDLSGTPHLAVLGGRPTVLASEKHGPAWAVDLGTGALLHGSHLLEMRTALVGSGGYADGVEVISSTDADRIAGFDAATGDLLWEQSLPSTTFAPVALGNGLAWIGSYAGQLKGYDLHTGREVAALDAGGGVLGGAALADGRVVVGALDLPAGTTGFGDSLGKLPGSVSMWSP
ncbi:MAG: PQQ-binding-like beta-propeller repeat protein, partial [Halobacteriales archaeon]|nr:PQQ-binding-like beta-propeller repeat protein [Halobacteriales archaeon]